MPHRLFALLLALLIGQAASAQMLLLQSTARTVPFGPFLDETDGKTAETALTLSQADIRLSKNGGAFAQTNNSAGASHLENGVYGVPLDTTDTATLGHLRVEIHESGAVPVWQDFLVVPANTFNTLVLGTDALNADVDEVNGSSVSTSTAQIGVNVVNLGGSATPVTNLGTVYNTAFATAWNSTLLRWNTNQEYFGGFAVTGDMGKPYVVVYENRDKGGYSLVNPLVAAPNNFPNLAINASGYVVLQDGSLTATKIADNAITEPKIAAGAINVSEAPNLDALVSSRLAPTTAGRTIDVTSGGAVGIDWANIESPGTTVSLTGTEIDNIHSLDSNAVDQILAGTPPEEFFDNAPAGGGGGTPLTADVVVPARTFYVGDEGNKAENIITLNAWSGDPITLSADFSGPNGLNPGTSLQSIDSVTVTNIADDTEITTSNEILQQSYKAANFDVAEIDEPGRFTVLVKVTTSDSQPLTLKGTLVVE